MKPKRRRRVVAVGYHRSCCCTRELVFALCLLALVLIVFIIDRHLPDTGISQIIDLFPGKKGVALRMAKRKLTLLEACSKSKVLSSRPFTATNLEHIQYNDQYNMLYCGVEKAGSTFWRRFLQHLHYDEIDSPYKILPKNTMHNYRSVKDMETEEFQEVLKKAVKFLFVRDPYERLLSGYVDKLFSPNPYFWKTLGKYIVMNQRKGGSDDHYSQCGHDVTFAEFIDYVIEAETSRTNKDGHFSLASDLCNPCHVKFDLIGKTETFVEDTFHIFKVFNITRYINYLLNFDEDCAEDAIVDTSQTFFSIRSSAYECLSPQTTLARLWRKLQMRGVISAGLPCPIPPKEAGLFSERRLLDALRNAHRKSTKKELQQQKRKMLILAYQQIPLPRLKILSKLFKRDFDLFGYDPLPDELFNRTSSDDDHEMENVFEVSLAG